MRYLYTINPSRDHKAEVGEVNTHVDAICVLLRAVKQQRKAFIEVELRGGARAEVGHALRPPGKQKPWTHSIMEPNFIRGFFPTVKLRA